MTAARAARYQSVKRHVLGAIRTGRWRAGDRIASEHELVRELGVARMTVRRALDELTREGRIVRRAGVGAFVAGEPLAESHPLEIRDIAEEVAARGHAWRAEVAALEAATADAELARWFAAAPGAPLFRSEVIHWEGETPIQLERRWVSPAIFPDYLAQDFTRATPAAHLLAAAPIEAGEQIVRAEAADARTAGLLRLARGAPVLTVARRTWSRGQVASAARLIHPGHAFQLAGRFGDIP
ncbi:MAG: histidine utilization repressor [Pseudomonadota bacterium]